ncbi:uncharacterized protein F5891DRAFT_1185371 [Suillus fuscotomentosus]|uniref:Uncharacterized protein n=1 Tax=Suillus fuscotomentosus TaxID=1912939 RepID=A0AAD4HQF7_9AGAM|nr:uncharacterized protein F5891DRAFT_1185371 [Suillus fuscotomentosus]KAG1903734.1 hypothetical protein F5891DRAFT_1185371 [Suillus fuscotomentosus]
MAPPRWTSAEQLLWLQNEMPGYLQMQKEKKLPRFFDSLFPRWFSDFPEETELNGSPPCDENAGINEPSSAGIESVIDTAQLDSINAPDLVEQEDSQSNSPPMGAAERRKKLREWFRNNSKGKTTPGGSSTGRALSVLLGQRARGTRDLKEIEVYSKLHYESKVKPLVEDALKNNIVQPTQRLSTVRLHTTECFAEESEEVKKEIREETVRLNASRRLGNVEGQHPRTKEEVYRTIQELPLILGQVFEELSALTGGWHYTVVMGGADPLCEGDIMTLSYHHGKTADGLSFKASTPNFHEQYLLPFERHLGYIHGPSSKCISAPSSTPTSSHLAPVGLISLDEFPNESSLGENVISGPVVGPSLLQEPGDLVLNPYINLDFGGSVGANEHGDWLMHASSSDPNLPSPHNMTDTPITAWRKSMALNEDPLASPTFNRIQQRGLSAVGPSAEAVPPFLPHPLSPLHTTLLPQPSSFFVFPALEEVDALPTLQHHDPLAFNQPMLNSGPRSPPDQPIPLPLSPLVSTASKSPHSKSVEHQPSPASHQPTHQPNSEAMTVSVDCQSSPASHRPTPHDIVGVSADDHPQPNLEVRTVSSLPTAASGRRSGCAPHPSTRADGANKIGGHNSQRETKLAPKRKLTEVQRGVGGSKKRSRK